MTAPGAMEIRTFPYPALEPGAMLMRMELSGVCGTDKHTYNGENIQYAGTEQESSTPFPIIPGHENVGVVAEITQEARTGLEFHGQLLDEGDRVVMCPDVVCGKCWFCRHVHGYPWCDNVRGYGNAFSTDEAPSLFGGWAEHMYIRPDVFVFKVPDGLAPDVAVLAELMTVAFSLDDVLAMVKAGFSDETVVVQGVGPLGLCCLIRSRILGAGDIVATDLSDFRLGMAQRFSADHTLNAGTTSADERIDTVRQRTHGRGADVVIGCTGVPESFVEGLEMLRKGGTYVELGNFVDTGSIDVNVHRHVCAKNARIIGVTNHPYTQYDAALRTLARHGDEFPFDEIVTHRYPLDDAERAVLRSMDPDTMKVVIEP